MAGRITSGIGLISGLPTQSIIDQLIAIESRPVTLLRNRVQNVQTQRTAFADLSARLLGLKSITARLDETSFFRASTATSSQPDVLTATAGPNAVHGTYQFQVRSLVSNHQLISRGFATSDQDRVGAGTLAIEIGQGHLHRPTSLDALNGGEGVRRGSLEITDRSGAKAVIDLRTALTVDDVLEAINNREDIRVSARVDGARLVLEDQTGETTAVLKVRDLHGGFAAADLGLAGQDSEADGILEGRAVLYLDEATRLNRLNDDNGVTVGKTNKDLQITLGGQTFVVGLRGLLTRDTALDVLNSGEGVRAGTFRITNRAGVTADLVIDDEVHTVGDVIDRINNAGIGVVAAPGAAKGQFIFTDESTLPEGQTRVNFKIENVSGHAATDLGIVTDTNTTSVTGLEIHRVESLGDVLRAVNHAVDQNGQRNTVLEARVGAGGLGVELVRVGGEGEFTVTVADDAVESQAAEGLGLLGASTNGTLAGRDLLAGLNTVLLHSLNGGQAVALGEVLFRAADASQAVIDFTGIDTVQGLIDRVNAETAVSRISARLNEAGNGLIFVDESGVAGTTVLKDFGVGSGVVRDLFGLDDDAGGRVESTTGLLNTGSVQLQYVSSATRLAELNGGRGVAVGSFRITAADGQTVTVALNANQKTVGDVLAQIRAAGLEDVDAAVNDRGDGIVLHDRSTGTGRLRVDAVNGATTARDLNLLGDSVDVDDPDGTPRQSLDGSYEFHLEIDADDTLDDVRTKLNESNVAVSASVIRDGSGTRPFRLILTSEVSGTRGRVLFDGGSTGLSADTLVRPQDAVVFFGGSDSQNPIVLTSPTNSVSGVIPDVTLNLVGTSSEPVELSIASDVESVISDLSGFVSSYNTVLDRLASATAFDAESNERGPLFGDSSIDVVRSRLRQVLTVRVSDAPQGFDTFFAVGISAGDGGRLRFDEQKFRDAFAADPEAVEKLFTTPERGIGDRLESALEGLTRTVDGVLPRKDKLLADREEFLNERITALQELLSRKRARLERQFQGLEASLSNLQGAQSALAAIARSVPAASTLGL